MHIDEVESHLIENITRAISSTSRPPALQLTGGRDSRLVLALVIRAGLLHEVDIVSHGAPNSPDSTLARELTVQLGVKHTQLPWKNAAIGTSQLAKHAGRVAGAVNCVDSSIPIPVDGRMILSGFLGETLRTNWPHNRAGYSDQESVVTGYLAMPLGRTRILWPEACEAALADGLQSLMAQADSGACPEDLLDAYYIAHRIRRWVATRPERFADEFFPLYDLDATRFAFQMDWRDRAAGRIHNRIIHRAGKTISDAPYYKPGNHYRIQHTAPHPLRIVSKTDTQFTDRTVRHDIRRLPGRATTLLHNWVQQWITDRTIDRHSPMPHDHAPLYTNALQRRKSTYREIVHARESNPAFDILDRDRLLSTIDVLDRLPSSSANEIHGAMTGVIWLGRLENEL